MNYWNVLVLVSVEKYFLEIRVSDTNHCNSPRGLFLLKLSENIIVFELKNEPLTPKNIFV